MDGGSGSGDSFRSGSRGSDDADRETSNEDFLEMTLQDLGERIGKIEERNRRVELDKAWETSLSRRGLLITFTYISIGTYMWVIGTEQPWVNAVIPTLGFMLSTLTLPFFKKMWLKKKR